MAATTPTIRIFLAASYCAATVFSGAGMALAQGGHGHGAAIGEAGTRAKVSRTIEITIQDNRYEPESIEVKSGETVRFVIKNASELLHEFNIGTAEMHAVHQKDMAQMVEHGMLTATGINHQMMNMDHSKLGMAPITHDDPNAKLVEPGKTAEIMWKFPKDAKLEFACNLPGHYEAGMVGQFHFRN